MCIKKEEGGRQRREREKERRGEEGTGTDICGRITWCDLLTVVTRTAKDSAQVF